MSVKMAGLFTVRRIASSLYIQNASIIQEATSCFRKPHTRKHQPANGLLSSLSKYSTTEHVHNSHALPLSREHNTNTAWLQRWGSEHNLIACKLDEPSEVVPDTGTK